MKKYLLPLCIIILCLLLSACSLFADPEPIDMSMVAGETAALPVSGEVYTSSDESIVTADGSGNITALGEGSAVVTVDEKQEIIITVTLPDISEIAFAEDSVSLKVGESYAAEVSVLPEYAPAGNFTFASSDERIATVDENGSVTAVGMGDAVITATLAENDSITCTLNVSASCDKAEDFYFEAPYVTLCVDETSAPVPVVVPYGAEALGISWVSADETVATVSADGIITAHSVGSTLLTATLGDKTAEYYVNVARRSPAEPLAEIPAPRYTKNEEGVLVRENGGEQGSARIMLIGDLMCLSAQQGAVRRGGVYDFNSTFSIVKDIFAKSDFAVGNLETLISHSNAYSGESKSVNGNPNCNGPATYLDAVRYGGLDAVVLANNHSGDGGISGVYDTLAQVDKYRLARTGVFGSGREQRFMLVDINGIKVGIASYTGHVNGRARTIPAEMHDTMLNFYTPEKAQADVAAMKQAGAEYIIVYMHWGTENTHSVNAAQREQAQQLADMGVNFIAGSHPHCLQEAEILTSADGREVICIYSLGNFVSSMGRPINNDTIIIDLELTREGEDIAASASYIGCRVIGTFGDGKYVVVPVSPALNGGTESSGLNSAANRIRSVMGDALPEKTEF